MLSEIRDPIVFVIMVSGRSFVFVCVLLRVLCGIVLFLEIRMIFWFCGNIFLEILRILLYYRFFFCYSFKYLDLLIVFFFVNNYLADIF